MTPAVERFAPLYQEALRRLQALRRRHGASGVREPAAVTLATADARARVSARTVLLKTIDARGLVWYTNLRSRKARQLAANPRAAVCLYSDHLKEQALIEGPVEAVSPEEADAYWRTRDRRSQVGAWASLQSQPLSGRRALLARAAAYAAKFAGGPVPRPPHWSGCRLVPERLEFWKAQPFRLHERVLYERHGQRWTKTLLYP